MLIWDCSFVIDLIKSGLHSCLSLGMVWSWFGENWGKLLLFSVRLLLGFYRVSVQLPSDACQVSVLSMSGFLSGFCHGPVKFLSGFYLVSVELLSSSCKISVKLYVVFRVRFLSGFCLVSIKCLSGLCQVSVRFLLGFLSGSCQVSVRFLSCFCQVLVRFL
jgi:hypothetical protein